MKFIIALWFGKIINFLVNIIDRSRGSNLAGQWAMKIDSRMVYHFWKKGIDCSRVLFVTGTNGKSTTNNLINHIFKENGKRVVSNLEGANLVFGIATSLIKASTLSGRVDTDYFIFETDERYLPIIREQLPAENVIITNLEKDQVQRNGDPDFIYRKLEKAFAHGVKKMYLNNEEPRSQSLGRLSEKVVTYGVEKHSEAFLKDETYVTMPCPYCRHKIKFRYFNTDGMGQFRCTGCGYESAPHGDYEVKDVDFDNKTFTVHGVTFPMPYDMPYMIYNYSAAVAVAEDFGGIAAEDAEKAFPSFRNVGGRYEVLRYRGKTIKYMRIKQENPETLQSTLNVIASDKKSKMVILGLYPVADFVPYYTNTFYSFDCDYSHMVKSNVEKYFCFSDPVCYDAANRLIYEGVDPALISIDPKDDPETILREVRNCNTDNIYMITWMHIFQNLQEYVRKEGEDHD